MGATVTFTPYSMQVTGVNVAAGDRLKAFDLDFNLIPDAAMTAAALAMFADGPCTLRNIASGGLRNRPHPCHAHRTC